MTASQVSSNCPSLPPSERGQQQDASHSVPVMNQPGLGCVDRSIQESSSSSSGDSFQGIGGLGFFWDGQEASVEAVQHGDLPDNQFPAYGQYNIG